MAEQLRDIEPIRPLLAQSPLAVISDIDGTLAPIVSDPAAARVPDRIREALRGLMARGVRVGLITGRDVATALRITGLPEAWYAANHGLTLSIDGAEETPEAVRDFVPLAEQVLRETAGVAGAGVQVEDKGPVLAFHYRRAPSPEKARQAILAAIAGSQAASRFAVQEGRMIVELRPPLDLNKGTALEALVRRMGAAAVICFGDDITDLDMFRRLRAMRESGTPAATIAVASAEVSDAVVAEADYGVESVEAVQRLLEALLRVLPARGSAGP
jgi:trehalose 6-phosphate phosphatase